VRAQVPRDLFAAVDRAVVGNEDLAVYIIIRKKQLRPLDAQSYCFGFVQTRHQYGQFHFAILSSFLCMFCAIIETLFIKSNDDFIIFFQYDMK
jgi:hypothetical protein